MKVIHRRDLARCPFCGTDQFDIRECVSIPNPLLCGMSIGTSTLYECLVCYGEWVAHSLGTIDQCLLEEVE